MKKLLFIFLILATPANAWRGGVTGPVAGQNNYPYISPIWAPLSCPGTPTSTDLCSHIILVDPLNVGGDSTCSAQPATILFNIPATPDSRICASLSKAMSLMRITAYPDHILTKCGSTFPASTGSTTSGFGEATAIGKSPQQPAVLEVYGNLSPICGRPFVNISALDTVGEGLKAGAADGNNLAMMGYEFYANNRDYTNPTSFVTTGTGSAAGCVHAVSYVDPAPLASVVLSDNKFSYFCNTIDMEPGLGGAFYGYIKGYVSYRNTIESAYSITAGGNGTFTNALRQPIWVDNFIWQSGWSKFLSTPQSVSYTSSVATGLPAVFTWPTPALMANGYQMTVNGVTQDGLTLGSTYFFQDVNQTNNTFNLSPAAAVTSSTFTGTICNVGCTGAGNVLTTSGVTGTLAIGQTISGVGVTPVQITSGSGSSWVVNGAAQNISSAEPMSSTSLIYTTGATSNNTFQWTNNVYLLSTNHGPYFHDTIEGQGGPNGPFTFWWNMVCDNAAGAQLRDGTGSYANTYCREGFPAAIGPPLSGQKYYADHTITIEGIATGDGAITGRTGNGIVTDTIADNFVRTGPASSITGNLLTVDTNQVGIVQSGMEVAVFNSSPQIVVASPPLLITGYGAATFNGTISNGSGGAGNILTINSGLVGTVAIGQVVSGTGVTAASITGGSGTSWTVSGAAQNVTGNMQSATNPANGGAGTYVLNQTLSNPIANATFNGTISNGSGGTGNNLTINSGLVGTPVIGQYVVGTGVTTATIISGSGSNWIVSGVAQNVTANMTSETQFLIGTPGASTNPFGVTNSFTLNASNQASRAMSYPLELSATTQSATVSNSTACNWGSQPSIVDQSIAVITGVAAGTNYGSGSVVRLTTTSSEMLNATGILPVQIASVNGATGLNTTASITGASWANTSGGQTTFSVGANLTTTQLIGAQVNVTGVVSTGGTGVGFNGLWTIVSVTSSTIVISQPAGSSPGTYASGGTLIGSTLGQFYSSSQIELPNVLYNGGNLPSTFTSSPNSANQLFGAASNVYSANTPSNNATAIPCSQAGLNGAAMTGVTFSGTTMTVGAVTSGTIAIGQAIYAANTGLADQIYITAGSGLSWMTNIAAGIAGPISANTSDITMGNYLNQTPLASLCTVANQCTTDDMMTFRSLLGKHNYSIYHWAQNCEWVNWVYTMRGDASPPTCPVYATNQPPWPQYYN